MAWGWRRRYNDYEDEDREDEKPDEGEIFGNGKWPFGGEGQPRDIPVPFGAVVQQISEMLSRADNNAGEYSFGGQASTLPAAPGLDVNGVGLIPLPLTEEHAIKLVVKCDKSPFGRKLDTMTDENVRKSWQLAPDQVEIKNPLWHRGIEKLSDTIAGRLGYKDIPMQCKLYKMLVYGEGGHFVKHQDTEKEDGMVATLVVQLPSVHEGGDLVVYRRGELMHRHDFGKQEGTAAYLPHYAVHYADAEHALETVVSGYRLVLVYSICLPPTMRHLMRNHDQSLSEELAGVVNGMGQDDESFALLLSHEYTEKSIVDLGSGALKGIDRARVQALEEANSVVFPEKKLQLFIARLTHDVSYYDDGGSWEENDRNESIHWYSTDGDSHGSSSKTTELKLNFLNPGRETFSALWANHGNSTFEGYLGNEGATRNTTYSRYALVAWPAARGVENSFKYINVNAAVDALQAQRPVDAGTLRTFMNLVCSKLAEAQPSRSWEQPKTVSVGFCRSMCELLIDAGDLTLVNLFFNTFVKGLSRYKTKDSLAHGFAALARHFDWNDIGHDILSSLGGTVDPTGMGLHVHEADDSGIRMALQIADGLDVGVAQLALLNAAVEKAARLREEDLCASNTLNLLWKWTIKYNDSTLFNIVATKFAQAKARLLKPVIKAFTQHIGNINASDERFRVLTAIVSKRIEWLNSQLEAQGQSFSWEMPDAYFPDNAHVQAFLRGPNVSMDTIGVRHFNGIQHARNYAAKWMREKQMNASFTLEAQGRGQDAYVIITKTMSWFSQHQKKLIEFKEELNQLSSHYGGDGNPRKRPRVEQVM